MNTAGTFFQTLSIGNEKELRAFSKLTGIDTKALKFYNDNRLIPSGKDMECISKATGIQPNELAIRMGLLCRSFEDAIAKHGKRIFEIIKEDLPKSEIAKETKPIFQTVLGKLYRGDCLNILRKIENNSIDLVFADPPFNLNKLYPSKIDDDLKTDQYLRWCEEWLFECSRVLKDGGTLFLWNLPKWNSFLARYINSLLTFRHWIATDIKYSLPIPGRFYPSHYSLLFYCKGEKPKVFHPDRMPMAVCPKCHGDLVDYGGYKDKMNPKGVNLTDVWADIPPVRHRKYKGRKDANELSIKLLDRIIEAVTDEGDTVLDPFGGSGTSYIVAEIKKRNWIGIEIGPITDIIDRFSRIEKEKVYLSKIRSGYNRLFTHGNEAMRLKKGLWTCDTVKKTTKEKHKDEQIRLSL